VPFSTAQSSASQALLNGPMLSTGVEPKLNRTNHPSEHPLRQVKIGSGSETTFERASSFTDMTVPSLVGVAD
jgi:hypothetical protein